MKPRVIDLFCGLFGWGEAFASEGWEVIGFDIVDMCRELGRPKPAGCQLVLQDVLTLDGRQFRGKAHCIVASPPCQRYSYMAMPWDRAKREIRWQQWQRDSPFSTGFNLNDYFNAAFRIAQEAELPLILENVKGAQPWVGRAKWHFGSFYLWGDLPALMPGAKIFKRPDRNFHHWEKTGESSPSFHGAPHETRGLKTVSDVNRRDGFDHTRHLTNQRESDIVRNANAFGWKSPATTSKATHARRAASAEIAKIPPDLAQWIARVFKPPDSRPIPPIDNACQDRRK